MYDLINQIISHNWTSSDSAQQYIFQICGALILIFMAVMIDILYRIISNFFTWRA